MPRAVVRIVEGESTLPAECTPLGLCDVELPAFLPKGSPVELTYEYNLYDSDDDDGNCYCGAKKCRGTMFSEDEVKRRARKARSAGRKL